MKKIKRIKYFIFLLLITAGIIVIFSMFYKAGEKDVCLEEREYIVTNLRNQ